MPSSQASLLTDSPCNSQTRPASNSYRSSGHLLMQLGQQASCWGPALSYGWRGEHGWVGCTGRQTDGSQARRLVSSELDAVRSPALRFFILVTQHKIHILQRAPAIRSSHEAADIRTKPPLCAAHFYFSHLLYSLTPTPSPHHGMSEPAGTVEPASSLF